MLQIYFLKKNHKSSHKTIMMVSLTLKWPYSSAWPDYLILQKTHSITDITENNKVAECKWRSILRCVLHPLESDMCTVATNSKAMLKVQTWNEGGVPGWREWPGSCEHFLHWQRTLTPVPGHWVPPLARAESWTHMVYIHILRHMHRYVN